MSVLDQTRDSVTEAVNAVAAAAGVPSWAIPATLAAVTVAAVTGYRTTRAARAARTLTASSTGPTGRGEVDGAARADRVLQRVETVGTVVAALLATAVSASGMWRFFADVLGVTGPARVLMFAFLEVALFVAGVRARRHIREVIALMRARHEGTYTGPIPSGRSVHQVLVWVIVVLTGVMSAADTPHWSGKLLRLAAPAVAAILWEIGAVAELQAARIRYGITPDPLAWRYSLRRLLVLARLADPTPGDGDTTDALARVDRARRLTALVRARYRLEATSGRAPRTLATWRAWRVRRLTIAAVEHAALGTDPAAVTHVQYGLALLYTVHTGTAPAAVTHLDPWRTSRPEVEAGPEVATGVPDGLVPAVRPQVDEGWFDGVWPGEADESSDGASSGGRVRVLAVAARTKSTPGHGPVTVPVVRTAHGPGPTTARPSATGTGRSGDPVPAGAGEDARIVAELVARAEVPTVRRIKAEYRVGGSRAVQLRAAVAAELEVRAGSAPDRTAPDPAQADPVEDLDDDPADTGPEPAHVPGGEAVPVAAKPATPGPLEWPVAPVPGAGQAPRFEVVGPRGRGHRP